ncbi:hypothetical protein [Massilia endophytica]|uniref:hypothetical protein n=1 Tax=Massilia endophytica TaxID=2899220 RepID=UPI001E4B846C|nr:hypothetical protein [Massilia endophytica]UGQ45715.1 hypothetical protein LSQ66_18275 [Massilia endophytica]
MKKLTIAALALLAGCTMPYRPAQFAEAGASFPGLADFAAQSPSRRADVMLVHGMCTHDATWAAETVDLLAQQLGANVGTKPGPGLRGLAGGVEIIPSTVTTPAGELRFQALVWSPLTTPLKQQLCYDQSGKSEICTGATPYTLKRARWNAQVKDWLVDDCIPDALIYQGVSRPQIRAAMREAILRASSESDPSSPLVVISESLGSKILFDTLLEMSETPATQRAAMEVVGRLSYLIMAANQIPLLSLADQPLDGAGRSAAPALPDSLQRLLLKRRPPDAGRRSVTRLILVAFTDPSDLLSYTLLKDRYAESGVVLHNVLVSNTPTWFGLIADPVAGHLDYLANPDVGRIISCGEPKSALCK